MTSAVAPSLADFENMAQAAFGALPQVFRDRCDGLIIRVADFADPDLLANMGLDSPWDLTGVYLGTALTEKSHLDPVQMPDEIWLYRRPILDEWAHRGDVALNRLVAHVLVHEIAHHFGLSDADIAAIDRWWE